MKRTLSAAILVMLLTFTAFAQSFEGKITYQVTYKSKTPNLTSEQLSEMMGNTQEYFMKGGNYKSLLNGSLVQWQLYPSQDTVVYSKMSNTSSVYYTDATKAQEEVVKAEIKKGATTISGYSCDELTLTLASGYVEKYYFSQKLPVDAKLFLNHNYGNWYAFLEKANAVPLKMVVDSELFVIESVATEVKPMKLADSLFKLPAGATLEKSPF